MKEQKNIITTNSVLSDVSLATIKNILKANFKHEKFFFYALYNGVKDKNEIRLNKNTHFINNLIHNRIKFDNKSIKLINTTRINQNIEERILIYILPFSRKKKIIIYSFEQKNYNIEGNILENFDFLSEIKNIIELEGIKKKKRKLEKKINRKKKKEIKYKKENDKDTEDLKTIFLANLSHEIKTPMNSIIGFTDLLQIPNLQSEKVVKFANIANSNAKRLLNLLEDIIDLSKIETNNIVLNSKEIIATDLLNEIYILNNNKLLNNKDKNIHFSLSIQKAAELKKIKVDEVRIKQILSILLSNAINFTDIGSIILGIKTIEENKIQIYVKDTGTGIKEKNKEYIFKSFSQGGDFLKRNNEGSGLGLAIARGLLHLYNQELLYKSQENIGSIFYFNLPFIKE